MSSRTSNAGNERDSALQTHIVDPSNATGPERVSCVTDSIFGDEIFVVEEPDPSTQPSDLLPSDDDYREFVVNKLRTAYSEFPDQTRVDLAGIDSLLQKLKDEPKEVSLLDYGYGGENYLKGLDVSIVDSFSVEHTAEPVHPNAVPGYVIFSRLWAPKSCKPKAKVIFFHGVGEHILKYNRAFTTLVHEQKVAILAFDQRGHGHNPFHPQNHTRGFIGHTEGFPVAIADADCFLFGKRVVVDPPSSELGFDNTHMITPFLTQKPGSEIAPFWDEKTPFFVSGHSMGAGLSLFYARNRAVDQDIVVPNFVSLYPERMPLRIDGLFSTAPPLRLAETTRPNIVFKQIVRATTQLFPKFVMSSRIVVDEISSSPVNNYNNSADPFCHGDGSLLSITHLVLYPEVLYDEAAAVADAARGQPHNVNILHRMLSSLLGKRTLREVTIKGVDTPFLVGSGYASKGEDTILTTDLVPEGLIQLYERVPTALVCGEFDRICSPTACQDFVRNANTYFKWRLAQVNKNIGQGQGNTELMKLLGHESWTCHFLKGYKHDLSNESYTHSRLIIDQMANFINHRLEQIVTK